MLVGNLRGLAEAIITGDKYKADGNHRDLAEAIITGDKYKAPSGPLREFADAIISRDKYKAPSGPLRDLADAIITGDKYKAPSGPLRDFAEAIITGDKYKVGSSSGCFLTTACIEYAGLPDNCYELQTMRRFRDEYVCNLPESYALIEDYRLTAPKIISQIELRGDSEIIFPQILHSIREIIRYVEAGNNAEALELCKKEFEYLKTVYS